MTKKLAFSVTLKDCRVDEFRSGGPGGQNQNKRNTGIRIAHPPSGAVGESREERSQLQNKRTAFRRMAESPKFKLWVNQQLYNGETARNVPLPFQPPSGMQGASIREEDVLTEVRENGRWVAREL